MLRDNLGRLDKSARDPLGQLSVERGQLIRQILHEASILEIGVDGVILVVYKYCDPYGFDVPAMKSYMESKGVPVLYVEDEYSTSALGRMKTRVEAFLEMIRQ